MSMNIPAIPNEAPERPDHKCNGYCISWSCAHCGESSCEEAFEFNSLITIGAIKTLCNECYVAAQDRGLQFYEVD
jgi:hypothetical protein